MDAAFRASLALCRLFAAAAKAGLAAIAVLIVIDVAIRNLGGRPPLWTVPACEYLLFYIAILGAPYLVRTRGHVVIEVVIGKLGGGWRRGAERAVCLAAAACFAYLGSIGLGMALDAYATGDAQIRSVRMPSWIVYAAFPLGFWLAALEFARYLFVADSLFTRRAQDADAL